MKVSKKRLLQIVYDEVEKLKEDRFSDTAKTFMDDPTKYKMPVKQKSYMPPDQKGAYQEPPEYPEGDPAGQAFYFGDTISERILDLVAENVGEENPILDSLDFVQKVTRYVYNELRYEIGEQQWSVLETEWNNKGVTQGSPKWLKEKGWLEAKMKKNTVLGNAVYTAYIKFADIADPAGAKK